MPRKACLIFLNPQTDLFYIQNTAPKCKIFVDRLPLAFGDKRTLQHHSLVQIGSDFLGFFLLPQESVEKRKRFLKERRKQITQMLMQ
jgi:hypothetical protein